MRVVVTRPAQEARRWVEALQRRGHDAVALPLLAIAAAPDPDAVRLAAREIASYAAVMFVSANAVQGFFEAGAGTWPGHTRAWAPGPATGEALRTAGVPPGAIDAPSEDAPQFDSESLWLQVSGQLQRGDRLLLVRGAGGDGRAQGREWLSRQLAAAGVHVHSVVSYSRGLPAWSSAQGRIASRAATDGSLWLFSSTESAGNLHQLLPQQAWSAAHALATHPRIAAAVRALGFGNVRESRPTLADVLASIESAG